MSALATNMAGAGSKAAQARVIEPVAADLQRAGLLSVLAGALWPVQAAVLAWALSRLIVADSPVTDAGIAGALFLACGIVKNALEHRAGAYLFKAADETIARERAVLITREARAPTATGSAAIASLLVQKLPLLQPWITRYQVAMARAMVLPLLLVVLAFSQSWVVGCILLIAGPLIPVFMALVGMAAEDASRRQMGEISSINEMLMERLSAMLDIRLLGATDSVATDFKERAENLRQQTMAVLRIAFLSSTVLELFAALGVAMVAVFVGFSLLGEIEFGTWGHPLSVGQGLFLLLIAPEFFQPLRDLAGAWHDRAAGLSVIAELDELDKADRVKFVGNCVPSESLPGTISIVVSNAIASLPQRQVALPELQIVEGQSIALTGPSGAGKTTALAAIAGLVPLADGHIDVCGVPLSDATADAWRRRIALMPQRLHFPHASLAEWLAPEQQRAGLWKALQQADADTVVKRLADGLQTHLGETGGGVSGGEARRLLLARAIHTGADVVLADEPTADLDPHTAEQIISTLQQLQGQGLTLIVASHDPQLIAAMDRQVEIVV